MLARNTWLKNPFCSIKIRFARAAVCSSSRRVAARCIAVCAFKLPSSAPHVRLWLDRPLCCSRLQNAYRTMNRRADFLSAVFHERNQSAHSRYAHQWIRLRFEILSSIFSSCFYQSSSLYHARTSTHVFQEIKPLSYICYSLFLVKRISFSGIFQRICHLFYLLPDGSRYLKSKLAI